MGLIQSERREVPKAIEHEEMTRYDLEPCFRTFVIFEKIFLSLLDIWRLGLWSDVAFHLRVRIEGRLNAGLPSGHGKLFNPNDNQISVTSSIGSAF